MSTGLIDVVIGDVENMLTSGFCDKVLFRYDIPNNFLCSSVCISERVWENLSPNHQEIIMNAVIESCQKYGSTLYYERLETDEVRLAESGVETLYLPPEQLRQISLKIDGAIQDSISFKDNENLFGNNET